MPVLQAALPILLAGIIGFLLGELKARLDTRRSDKAALKRVLYNQLELWEAVTLAEPRTLITKALRAVDKIINKLGGQKGSLETLFRATDYQEQRKFFDVMQFNVKDDIIDRYEKSVAELASVDPVLTYKLTNKASLGRLDEATSMLDRLVMKFDPLFLVSDSNTQLVERMKAFYKEKGAEWKVKKIKRDIKRVAWRISIRTWLRVLWLFGKERFWVSKDTSIAMLQLLRIIIDHYSKRNAQAESAAPQTESRAPQYKP